MYEYILFKIYTVSDMEYGYFVCKNQIDNIDLGANLKALNIQPNQM